MWSRRSLPIALLTVLLLIGGPAAALDLDGTDDANPRPAMAPQPPGPSPAGAAAEGEPPLLPEAMNAGTVLQDPELDVRIAGAGETDQEYTAPMDILSLGVAETLDALSFRLQHRAYPDQQAMISHYVPFTEVYCDISFVVQGNDEARYGLELVYPLTFEANPPYTSRAEFYIETTDDDNRTERARLANVPSRLVENDHFEVLMLKSWLELGPGARPLKAGAALHDFSVYCQRMTPTIFIQATDDAAGDPREGYEIRLVNRTREISLRVVDGRSAIGVAMGETSQLQVEVKNHADRKLLVNITAEVIDRDGKPVEGWSVRSATTLELNVNRSLPATIVAAVDEDVLHRTGGMLKVVAYPLGYEEEATVATPIYASLSPSPERSTLHFHWGETSSGGCNWTCLDPVAPVGAFELHQRSFLMNVLEDDPQLGDDAEASDRTSVIVSEQASARLDVPLARPLRLDPEDLIDLTLNLRSDTARDVRVRAMLWTSSENVVAQVSKTVPLTENFQQHTFHIPVTEEITDIPKGDLIGLSIRVEDSGQFGIYLFGGSSTSVYWDPSETTLDLPLVALPERKVNITDGRALPSIVLGNDTDREEYVNPGQPVAFDLVLLNQGTEADTLRLTTHSSRPGWKVDFHPGNRFALDSGASAPLCVLVTAPEDAKEGDVTNLTLTATSKLDAEVQTEAELVLIVTTHEFEPGSCREVSEDEYVKPVTDDAEESPLGILPFLVLSVLALVAHRMRR